ncbi:hypothetical protein CYLTODRAFT_174948 [Cylindrobasidium torrendii FP15055 ss-10]|uniref:Secreted protein n=1 Tax=Cylindrobasidium torrendii FP15055 ss-10 TaxID=1314674 RepID=A0A0D7BKJ0_9AGAR|nr:hypothetical protein CYLTODRAFT_174948 [Cylindrobasidium torrendii FP15055 ss-10]
MFFVTITIAVHAFQYALTRCISTGRCSRVVSVFQNHVLERYTIANEQVSPTLVQKLLVVFASSDGKHIRCVRSATIQ